MGFGSLAQIGISGSGWNFACGLCGLAFSIHTQQLGGQREKMTLFSDLPIEFCLWHILLSNTLRPREELWISDSFEELWGMVAL